MKARKIRHKFSCNTPTDKSYNVKVYQFIRANGGFENWSMILVDYVDVNNKQELQKKERIYIEQLKPTLNHNIPTRTPQEYSKEYRKNNKEKIQEYNKKYKTTNKEKIYEKIKCECGYIIRKDYIVKHRKTQKHICLMTKATIKVST
jgi:hypothetical protein